MVSRSPQFSSSIRETPWRTLDLRPATAHPIAGLALAGMLVAAGAGVGRRRADPARERARRDRRELHRRPQRRRVARPDEPRINVAQPRAQGEGRSHKYLSSVKGFSAKMTPRGGAGAVRRTRRSPTSSRTGRSRRWPTSPTRRRGAWTASTSATCRSTTLHATRTRRRGRDRVHHRHRHPDHAHGLRRARDAGASTPPTTATTPTATGTARTSPAPSAARSTAWPRASSWSPSRCSTAPAAARPRA